MNKFQTLETNLPQSDDFTTLARMKRILYYGLFQKYVEIWTEMEEFLQEYENNLKRTLRTQSRICKKIYSNKLFEGVKIHFFILYSEY